MLAKGQSMHRARRRGLILALLTTLATAALANDEGATKDFARVKWVEERLRLAGRASVAAYYVDAEDNSSDVFLDQVRLELAANINERVLGVVALNFEDNLAGNMPSSVLGADTEDDESVQLDEAYIKILGLTGLGLEATAGKQYFPFGNVNDYGHFVNDSLARQLYETRDTGATVSVARETDAGVFRLAAFAFNGPHERGDAANQLDTWGAAVAFELAGPATVARLGGSYLSNLWQAANVSPLSPAGATLAQRVGAYSLYGVLELGRASLAAEWVAPRRTLDGADVSGIAGVQDDFSPQALSVEAAWQAVVADRDIVFAVKYEDNRDLEAFTAVDSIVGGAVSAQILPHTRLALNYEYWDLDSLDAAGKGRAHLWLTNLTVEF